MDNIKAVLFDFDYTLGNRYRYAYLSYSAFIREYLPDITDEVFIEALRQDMMYFDEYGNAGPRHVIRSLENKYGFSFPGVDFWQWWVENQGKYACLYDDAVSTLDYLKKKYRLGIVTNGVTYSQRLKIRNCHIEDYFEHIVVSEDAGIKKPDPGIFEYACRQFGLKPEECLYIGDMISNDVYGAVKAGMKAIWICKDEMRENMSSIPRISTLKELTEML
ncbi:MAG: HAD family hydrolase [Erysipelotrichaceae bacterium]|nr:HAD family hydrolase [Erysipelotrichaceae bacterium]